MKFTKVQGAGNDFILVETGETDQDWSQMAVAMCDRHFGIGGDGLLLLLPSDKADFRMREFNADGSEAETCGNGLRCLAKYAIARGLTNAGAREISIETVAGISKVEIQQIADEATKFKISMGKPKLGAKDIPVILKTSQGNEVDIKSILSHSIKIENRELLLHFVSMGNPHAVHFGQEPVSDFSLAQLGPQIEHHEMFPNRVNFEIANIISRQKIEARVWERGVGETLACGSGACAIAVAAQLLGYINNEVAIKLPGGVLEVEWDRVREVSLSGTAEIVFTGKWPG